MSWQKYLWNTPVKLKFVHDISSIWHWKVIKVFLNGRVRNFHETLRKIRFIVLMNYLSLEFRYYETRSIFFNNSSIHCSGDQAAIFLISINFISYNRFTVIPYFRDLPCFFCTAPSFPPNWSMSSACNCGWAGVYLLNSMLNSPLPWTRKWRHY